ncbi:MAG: hypothetical protein ACUVT5_01500 [Candidatus Bathyarchaeales archaeon]
MRTPWSKRMLLLSLFILLDYLVTLVMISYPHEEANSLARIFMETFGVTVGLTFFSVLVNLPIYIILGIFTFYPQPLGFASSPLACSSLDIVFAWFVAGAHFSGALSWVLIGPSLLYQSIGAGLYLFLLFVVNWKSKRD